MFREEGNRIDERMKVSIDGLRAQLEEDKAKLAKERLVAKEASAQGDRSENAEWQIAMDNIAKLNVSILGLDQKISTYDSFVSGYIPCGKIIEGTLVKMVNTGTQKEYVIKLYPEGLGNASIGAVSVGTPVGRALLGHEVGDSVIVHAPMGDTTYTIKEVY